MHEEWYVLKHLFLFTYLYACGIKCKLIKTNWFLKETKEQLLNNTTDNQHIVTFINNEDQECTMFQVFDDNKDDEISGKQSF